MACKLSKNGNQSEPISYGWQSKIDKELVRPDTNYLLKFKIMSLCQKGNVKNKNHPNNWSSM